ncbi:hypothetical protein ASPWEDRAFT_37720 [Aspergillus wentii DTO 134E9]|uniref:Myb-like domain-containing protein n=1 Tax=Aspergillus wentii DTO 134E9 TaxID=1073089 RepID=A0A1L9RY54_ASPWE|nr:uncharacterized protein ASPWEDRAFT_37720 [Aspergillus wentii DTO 134E9]OJJ39859.1 hypothetical protein ASPWEDRAFT_37720 [Aspergillus wentii DTO 134E9]
MARTNQKKAEKAAAKKKTPKAAKDATPIKSNRRSPVKWDHRKDKIMLLAVLDLQRVTAPDYKRLAEKMGNDYTPSSLKSRYTAIYLASQEVLEDRQERTAEQEELMRVEIVNERPSTAAEEDKESEESEDPEAPSEGAYSPEPPTSRAPRAPRAMLSPDFEILESRQHDTRYRADTADTTSDRYSSPSASNRRTSFLGGKLPERSLNYEPGRRHHDPPLTPRSTSPSRQYGGSTPFRSGEPRGPQVSGGGTRDSPPRDSRERHERHERRSRSSVRKPNLQKPSRLSSSNRGVVGDRLPSDKRHSSRNQNNHFYHRDSPHEGAVGQDDRHYRPRR